MVGIFFSAVMIYGVEFYENKWRYGTVPGVAVVSLRNGIRRCHVKVMRIEDAEVGW